MARAHHRVRYVVHPNLVSLTKVSRSILFLVAFGGILLLSLLQKVVSEVIIDKQEVLWGESHYNS